LPHRRLPDPEDMATVFHQWLRWLPLYEDKPATTVRAYSQGVRRVVSFAGIQPDQFGPGSLDQVSLTDVVRELRASGKVSKATLTQTLAALKSFFDYCIADGHAETVPDINRIRKIAKLAVPQVDPEYLRPDEIGRLYREAKNPREPVSSVRWPARDLAMCAFLAVLGLRASELTSADLGWVTRERVDDRADRATWMMHVMGKGHKIRRLPLSPELADANRSWHKEREDRYGRAGSEDPLFLTNDGERFNYRRLRYWLRTLYGQAGLAGKSHPDSGGRSLHSLRHTAGVQLAAQGVPMNVIQSFLGHASIATTGIYTAIAGGELVGAVSQSDANTLLGQALKGNEE
jgi:site-specific recombinase XerD